MPYSADPKFAGAPERVIIAGLDDYIEQLTGRLAEVALVLQEADRMRQNQRQYFTYKLDKYLKQSKRHEQTLDAMLAKLKREKFIEDPDKPGKQTDLFGK